ncbi:MAG: hypothetical protein JW953_14780 [Anaerolineae bacterium]|nr:hypothetical protein [Anaerolineae bacterium]
MPDYTEIIREKERRLQELRKKQARFGISTSPEILTEIEDLEKEIPILKNKLEGVKIIRLLHSGLEEGLTLLDQGLYDIVEEALFDPEKDPKTAIKICKEKLTSLDKERLGKSESDINFDTCSRYSIGRYHLLLASLYLNQNNLQDAKDHFYESKDMFLAGGWFQLEALAYLGLAITQRKSDRIKDAHDACTSAERLLNNRIIPQGEHINLVALKQAIEEEKSKIQELLPGPPPVTQRHDKTIFDITTGAKIVAEKAIADLNLLGYKDYDTYAQAVCQILCKFVVTGLPVRHSDFSEF